MPGITSINFKEKKLLLAFLALILLTLLIGLFGMFQIQGLSRKIENLGRYNLKRQSAVLEMRISNAIYAMGIRNYIFWRTSRYLGAIPMAANVGKVLEAGNNFKKQLEVYRENAYLSQQKEWANQVAFSFDEVFALGEKIIQLADQNEGAKISEATNNRLMSFENRIYKIDDFLNNLIGKANLADVQSQLSLADLDKQQALFFLKISIISAMIVGILITFSVYRRRVKERLYRQDMYNRMINVEEDERKRLSNAVHDEMGQDLSALKIYLGVIQQGLTNLSQDMKDKINQCREIIAGLLEKSHNIAFLLRPPDLDEVGLVDSLEALLLEYKHLTGVEYNYQKPAAFFELSAEYTLLCYRITQELLTNMAKHSKAKHVELKLERKSNCVELTYSDDGSGFDQNLIIKKSIRRREDKFKLGLLGLQERVELLDGVMQVNSGFGKGTNIFVTLPI
jgi:signal transduction histidine kinase